MTLEEYKKSKSGHTHLKTLKKTIAKMLICGIIALGVLIASNLSESTKELIKNELFKTDFNFSKINKLYGKLFDNDESESVSLNTNLNYTNYSPYLDGVSLDMSYGEPISLMDSGIVVFIGEKEGYGNTLIVQQSNGIDLWYGNIENVSVALYDYVNKNTNIATSKNELFLVYQKNGEYLDYKEYIQ